MGALMNKFMDYYLFRGKSSSSGEWIKGSLVVYSPGYIAIKKHMKETTYGESGVHNVNMDTVCQSTGIRDKNGDLIYEGDIVDVDNERLIVVNGISRGKWGGVNKAGQFKYDWFERCHTDYKSSSLKVLGNKFDNQELLPGWVY